MTNDEYESRLRAAIAEAEASHTAAMTALNESDDHPMSQGYKSVQWMALIATGRVAGLVEALNLLTDEGYSPNLMLPGK